MIISIDTEKVMNKIQCPFMIFFFKSKMREEMSIKQNSTEHERNSTLNDEAFEAFCLKSGTRQR